MTLESNFIVVVGLGALWWCFCVVLGVRGKDSDLRWAWSDLIWLVVGIAGALMSLFGNMTGDDQKAEIQLAQSFESSGRYDIHIANWAIADRHCATHNTMGKQHPTRANFAPKICEFSELVRRELATPIFNHVAATRLISQLNSVCRDTSCPAPEIDNMNFRLKNYVQIYVQHRDKLDRNIAAENGNHLKWQVSALAALLLAFGVRLGRTIAELARKGWVIRRNLPTSGTSSFEQ